MNKFKKTVVPKSNVIRNIGKIKLGIATLLILIAQACKEKNPPTIQEDPCKDVKEKLATAKGNVTKQNKTIEGLFSECMEVDGFKTRYNDFIKAGASKEDAIESAIKGVLASPFTTTEQKKLINEYQNGVISLAAFLAEQDAAQFNANECAQGRVK